MREGHLLFTVMGYQLDGKYRRDRTGADELDALRRYTTLGVKFLCARAERVDTEELTRQMDLVLAEFRRAERSRRKAEKKAARQLAREVERHVVRSANV